nr:apolipoprotein N-acyltransferase [Enterovirga rhinocerotis]
MAALADAVILASGWRRALLAFGAGAVGALAMPPFGFWPALAVSLTIAVWLIDGSPSGRRLSWLSTLGRAAAAGWLWGFGYFVAGLWWLGAAFLVEADVFAWLLPFGVLGLPAVLAVFPAFGFAAARLIWSPGAGRIAAFAIALTASEWLRGHLFTGFPWNTLGMAFGQNLWLMQTASLVGLWGLTLIATLVLSAPATLGTADSSRGRYLPATLGLVAVAAMAVFGALRIPAEAAPSVAGVKLRIMQPNLPQDEKFRPSNGPAILQRYLALSDRSTSPRTTGLADVTHLIWPESAFPFLLHREPNALAQIASLLPPNTTLITGAARQGAGLPGEEPRRYFNAIQAVDTDGAITATYDKVHLVPFGEYVPHVLDAGLRAIGIRQFVHMPGGFTPGENRTAFRVAGLPPAAPTVCYEAIFPDEVGLPGNRPGWILNVTNDGWFGDTPGPYQHFAQARLRTVEQGLPLVRAANTGISAVIDPYGRVTAALSLGQEGVLDASLPSSIPAPLAARFASLLFLGLCTAVLIIAIGARHLHPRSAPPSSRTRMS